MEVRVLGPVEAYSDGRGLDLGPPQQRLVLAVLAVEAGRVVSTEALIDRVWAEAPEGARHTLQVHMSRIRRVLEQGCAADPAPARLVRRSGGYALDIGVDRVDVHRFRRLVEQARDPGRATVDRVALLREAVGLWRGEPLAGVRGQWAAATRQAWRQAHLDAVVAWAQAELDAGEPSAVIAPLCEVVDEHPLVESLAAVYMRALYAAGRPADALEHFTAVRRRLAEDLGADPGADLQLLHRQILMADPALAPPAAIALRQRLANDLGADPGPQLQQTYKQILSADPGLALPTASAAPREVPRQLPAPPQAFTGRAAELAVIDRPHDTSTVVVTAIDGMAGIGKTALALHWAHRVADRFPGGQLFIDLHGHTQGIDPIEPGEALDRMLRALGVPGPQIPASLDERAALYRTRLADQQMLILLDNAATETQVVPLLPGSPGCLVLITGRCRLAGLDHTTTLSLDTLPVADAVTLFTQTAGADRLRDQPPDLLVEVVEVCGRLPLAIRIAAARLRSHPTWTLSHLVERLRDQRARLDELEAGHRSVAAALDLSYQHLNPDQQHAYRLLGAHPGPDIDAYATAALLGSSVAHAGRMLEQLLDAHLLDEPTPGRYRFHDLTRAHAANTATRNGPEPIQDVALDRLLDYYRYIASAAMDAAYPYEREHRPQVPPVRTTSPDLPHPAAALDWLDTELPNLLETARYATEHGRAEHVLNLSTILHRHLRSLGRYHDAETLHHQALTTARAIGHRTGELTALNDLGQVHRLQGRNAQATDHYQQALRIARATGHRPGELDALTGLGRIHRLQGRYVQAADHYEQALRIARATGHRPGELEALDGLGRVHGLQGRYAQAADHYEQALRIARATGHRHGELIALAGLGYLHRQQGRNAQAADLYQQMLRIVRVTGHRAGELHALTGLGDIHRLQGRHAQAADHYRQLLDLARESGDRNFEFEARQGLGRLWHATGDPDAAIAHHNQALALAGELGQPVDQARAHDGLAHTHNALNQHQKARKHWQQALTILIGLGVNHTDDDETTVAAIRAHLARLDQPQKNTESGHG